jgi:hypothetical protein
MDNIYLFNSGLELVKCIDIKKNDIILFNNNFYKVKNIYIELNNITENNYKNKITIISENNYYFYFYKNDYIYKNKN